MLSLVLIVIIVGNVFLANFQMNQVDMEKMQENLVLSKVAETTQTSPPYTVQDDFKIAAGSVVSGNFADTQTLGSKCETFRQATVKGVQAVTNTKSPTSTSGTWVSPTEAYTDGGSYASSTNKNEQQIYGGYGFAVPTGATVTQVRVRLDAYQTKNDNLQVEVSVDGGSKFLEKSETLSLTKTETTYWVDVTEWTTWTPAYVNNLATRVTHAQSNSGAVKLDWIPVEVTYAVASSYALSISNSFRVDLGTYPLSQIGTIQIQLRYNVSSLGDTWFIQAYNWRTSTWSSNGFDNPNGNVPATTGTWNDYIVNVPADYVKKDTGEVQVRFFSGGSSTTQTDVSVDFFCVTAVLDSPFQVKTVNSSPETVHVVAVWVNTESAHTRYSKDVYFNSGEAITNLLDGIKLPSEEFVVKVITERGNVFVYAGN
jgi:hypothetical protein